SEGELPAATCLENLIFASQVLLGTGLGVVLFQKMSVTGLLAIDAASFLGSLLMLRLAGREFTAPTIPLPADVHEPVALRWQTLTLRQKRSLLILPGLAAVGSPAMALLPALAQQFQPENAAELALPLLFARNMGQLCGPMLLKRDSLTRIATQPPLLMACLCVFLAAYGVLPLLSGWIAPALGMIFIAYLASNIVFAAGTFGVLSSFQIAQIPAASSKAWRWQTLSASLFTGLAAMTTTMLGAIHALYVVSGVALLFIALVMSRFRG